MFVLYLLLGLIMLAAGAELLVRGGGQLALAMRIPALVVGLTVVAAGTSMPEVLVSVTAALKGNTQMALANVNGSNLLNVGLVLAASAWVRPLVVDRSLMRRDVPVLLILQCLLPVLFLDGVLTQFDGAILLLCGAAYTAWLLYDALRGRASVLDDDLELNDPRPWYHHLGLVVAGVAVLVGGANLFVTGAESVALWLGLSERFVGLTVLAIGTSAPELATSMIGAYRGQVDLVIGNVIGSNVLNIVIVLGLTSIVQPIAITDPGSWADMFAALVAALLLVPIVMTGQLNRLLATVLALLYLGYVGSDFFV